MRRTLLLTPAWTAALFAGAALAQTRARRAMARPPAPARHRHRDQRQRGARGAAAPRHRHPLGKQPGGTGAGRSDTPAGSPQVDPEKAADGSKAKQAGKKSDKTRTAAGAGRAG